ncbi:MAG: TniB family NTP-binding protein [Promethearchaeota archaeon]
MNEITEKRIKAPKITDLTKEDRYRRENAKYAVQILNYNIWFNYNIAKEFFKEFDVAYLQAYNYFQNPENNAEVRPLNFFLSGDMNTGKTTLVTKYINYCELIAKEEGREYSKYDIMYFETPVRVTFKQMFSSLLGTKFGLPIKGSALRNIHTNTLIDNIVEELRENKVKLLFIDEIQNLLEADLEDKKAIFNGLKKLTNQSQTRMILVGTPTAIKLFKGSDWVMERYRILKLPRWKENKEYLDLLVAIYQAYGDFFPNWDLVDSNMKINKDVGHFLYELSEGRLGKLIQIIRYGGVNALLNGRKNITKEDYNSVFRVNYSVEDGDIKQKSKTNNNLSKGK